MRRSVIAGVIVGLLSLGIPALVVATSAGPVDAAAAGHVLAQERPTKSQPAPGTQFSRPKDDKPWHYMWMARPMIILAGLFLLALAVGFLVRWIGLGRRAA